jgi:FAD/FMN-containing dehydrogenase
MYLLALVPFLTPFVMKMYAKWHGTHDRVLYRHEANHYQRYAVRAVDMGYAIPYDPTHTDALKRYDRLKRAWYSVVDSLEELKHTEQIYPQNLVMHARFVRGDSAALIAPSTENAHTMYIELLSFVGTPRYEEFFNLIERGWLRLGGRPHWAKLSFNVEKIRDAYPKEKMEKWLEIREKWDPDGIFLNDHLREVMKL